MLLHSNFKQESLSCEWSTKIKTDTSIYQNLVPIKTKKKRHKNSWNDYVTKTYVFTKWSVRRASQFDSKHEVTAVTPSPNKKT